MALGAADGILDDLSAAGVMRGDLVKHAVNRWDG